MVMVEPTWCPVCHEIMAEGEECPRCAGRPIPKETVPRRSHRHTSEYVAGCALTAGAIVLVLGFALGFLVRGCT